MRALAAALAFLPITLAFTFSGGCRQGTQLCSARQRNGKSKSLAMQQDAAAPSDTISVGERTNLTTLQKHIAFFDCDGDGYISPMDTFKGCRALGMPPPMAAGVTVLINGAQAPVTNGWGPVPFSIKIADIDRARHGSHTGVYDEAGHFDEHKFNLLFERYDKDRDGKLSWSEFMTRTQAQRHIYDPFGNIATVLEFAMTFWLAAEDGKIDRETLRGCYDGTLFEKIKARVEEKQRRRRRYW